MECLLVQLVPCRIDVAYSGFDLFMHEFCRITQEHKLTDCAVTASGTHRLCCRECTHCAYGHMKLTATDTTENVSVLSGSGMQPFTAFLRCPEFPQQSLYL